MKRFGLFSAILSITFLNTLAFGQDTTLTVTEQGNLGIGTTKPSNRLELGELGSDDGLRLSSTSNASTVRLYLDNNGPGGVEWIVQSTAGNAGAGQGKFVIRNQAANRFAIAANGNIGIGTTTPVDKLEVEGGPLTIDGAGMLGAIRFRENDEMKWTFLTAPFLGEGDFRLRDETTGNDVITFDSGSGNIGIGTVNPTSMLEVAGDTHVQGRVTSGDAAVSLPVAYGVINADGTIGNVTSNVSSTWNSAENRYEIEISGESYIVWDYVATVSVIGSDNPRMTSTGSVNNKLLVRIFDPPGSKVQNTFHFVVYKL